MAFLTVIPVGTAEDPSGERLGRAYFPAVGALLGLVAGACFALIAAVTTPLLAAVAATAAPAVLTGALHLDVDSETPDCFIVRGDGVPRLGESREPRGGGLVRV